MATRATPAAIATAAHFASKPSGNYSAVRSSLAGARTRALDIEVNFRGSSLLRLTHQRRDCVKPVRERNYPRLQFHTLRLRHGFQILVATATEQKEQRAALAHFIGQLFKLGDCMRRLQRGLNSLQR